MSGRPLRSSSNPSPRAWARTAPAPASITRTPPRTDLMLVLRPRGVETPEIFEHEATLLGSRAPQLLPGGISHPRARAGRPRCQRRGDMYAVDRRGLADPLFLLVGVR